MYCQNIINNRWTQCSFQCWSFHLTWFNHYGRHYNLSFSLACFTQTQGSFYFIPAILVWLCPSPVERLSGQRGEAGRLNTQLVTADCPPLALQQLLIFSYFTPSISCLPAHTSRSLWSCCATGLSALLFPARHWLIIPHMGRKKRTINYVKVK